jgi:hypothetical protein
MIARGNSEPRAAEATEPPAPVVSDVEVPVGRERSTSRRRTMGILLWVVVGLVVLLIYGLATKGRA